MAQKLTIGSKADHRIAPPSVRYLETPILPDDKVVIEPLLKSILTLTLTLTHSLTHSCCESGWFQDVDLSIFALHAEP